MQTGLFTLIDTNDPSECNNTSSNIEGCREKLINCALSEYECCPDGKTPAQVI